MAETKREPVFSLGVMTDLGRDPRGAFQKVRDLGFDNCQLQNPPDEYIYGPERVGLTDRVIRALEETGVRITSVFIMYPGHVWDLVDGPRTIGLVPEYLRAPRVVHACRISDWAREIGVDTVTSHMGFIPADASGKCYRGFIETMKAFVGFCAVNNQVFAFETGQETPAVLRRTIDDIGLDNLGVNLDPANLLMYGMGTPLEGVDAFGEWVVNTHCKDGCRPDTPGKLGPELPLGAGSVNFERLLPALYEKGFRGPLTIEREITGPEQVADILKAKKFLEGIKSGMGL